VVVGVGDEQLSAGDAQAARFIECRDSFSAVGKAMFAGAKPSLNPAFVWKEPLDLVVVAVRDVDNATVRRKPDWMLQARGISNAVLITEVKQPRSNKGFHLIARREFDKADSARLAISEIQASVFDGETAGLRKPGLPAVTVSNRFDAISGVGFDPACFEVKSPELMRSRHCDVKPALVQRKIPRRAKLNLRRRSGVRDSDALLACPRNRSHGASLKVGRPDCPVSGVGDVEGVPIKRHALRLPQSSFGETDGLDPVDRPQNSSVHVADQNTIVPAVSNEQSTCRFVGEHLSGKREFAGRALFLNQRIDRRAVDHPVVVVFRYEFAHRFDERFGWRFTFVLTDHHAGGIKEHERGPGSNSILPPDSEIGVVDDGVFDPVSLDSTAQAAARPFAWELGRVDANNDEFVWEFGFELRQLGKQMQTIDSAECPEIEDDQFAAEIFQPQWSSGVEPLKAIREVRRSNRSGVSRHRPSLLSQTQRLLRQ
jgi:hypothetical protein